MLAAVPPSLRAEVALRNSDEPVTSRNRLALSLPDAVIRKPSMNEDDRHPRALLNVAEGRSADEDFLRGLMRRRTAQKAENRLRAGFGVHRIPFVVPSRDHRGRCRS